ncbi:MAG: tyrosine-type recombinase/integrase [Planctomycetia bacterium]|nr:tyrosine-type recombinase/integrase [Planctomycetia bacterium]
MFTSEIGENSNRWIVRREFLAVVRRANTDGAEIPANLRFIDLRHTHASCLIADGMSIKAVSRRMGHGSIDITLKAYAHLMPDDDEKLATASQRLFS